MQATNPETGLTNAFTAPRRSDLMKISTLCQGVQNAAELNGHISEFSSFFGVQVSGQNPT